MPHLLLQSFRANNWTYLNSHVIYILYADKVSWTSDHVVRSCWCSPCKPYKEQVKFINVSIKSLGVFPELTKFLFDMLHDLKYRQQRIKYVKKKIIATCIRTSYYIFCIQNKDWTFCEMLCTKFSLLNYE